MKKGLFVFLLSIFALMMFSEEVFVQENGKFFKITISENGDTLSKEEILVENKTDGNTNQIAETAKIFGEISSSIEEKTEYDEQLFKKFIPYNWQIGWYGAWQGIGYGALIASGLNIQNPGVYTMTMLAVPSIMFFTPPFVLRESIINPRSVTFVDWGYRLGLYDYFTAKAFSSSLTNDTIGYSDMDYLLTALTGYTEAWGGYFISQKYLSSPRASGDFYAAGAVVGYVWGSLLGSYLTTFITPETYIESLAIYDYDSLGNQTTVLDYYVDTLDTDKYANQKNSVLMGTTLATSLVTRFAGYAIGADPSHKYKSGDAYVHAFNTAPGIFLAFELDNYMRESDFLPLIALTGGVASTAASMYIFKDIRFDDGNAILMQVAGVVGGLLFQGIERAIFMGKNEDVGHSSAAAIGIIGTEALFYYLRQDELKNGSGGMNLGLNLYPTSKDGMGINLTYTF